MTGKRDLMKALDSAAHALLERHFKVSDGAPLPEETNQIKAFAAVVNYYGPRTKLGGDEDTKESAFEQLKSGLHGGRRRKARGNSGAAAHQANGSGIPDDPSGSA